MPLKIAFVVGAIGVVVLPDIEVALSTTSTDPVTVPPNPKLMTAASEELEVGTVAVNVAERTPAADGVVVTGTLQSKEKSAFCAPQLSVPTVASGVVVSVAIGEVTLAAIVSGICTWKFWICVVPTVCGAKPCASTLRTSIPLELLDASKRYRLSCPSAASPRPLLLENRDWAAEQPSLYALRDFCPDDPVQ